MITTQTQASGHTARSYIAPVSDTPDEVRAGMSFWQGQWEVRVFRARVGYPFSWWRRYRCLKTEERAERLLLQWIAEAHAALPAH